MQKRHYEALATEWRKVHGWLWDIKPGEIGLVYRAMVKTFADQAQADNPAFSRTKFYIACGLEPPSATE